MDALPIDESSLLIAAPAEPRYGRYRVRRLIAAGGMAEVFEAVDEEIGKRLALKVLKADHAQSQEVVARFLNEARAINRIGHPGLVDIYAVERREDGTPYIVMEYLDGEVLSPRLLQRAPTLDGLHLFRQIASALAAAHERNVIHRDLKPNNVIIVSDPESPLGKRAKLFDFGIAKSPAPRDDGAIVTREGTLLGTPAYMAPEQFMSACDVTDRADVYSLGIMIYQVLGGQLPFLGRTPSEMMKQHMFAPPRPLRELAPSVSVELAALVHGMLAKSPDDRPSMSQVERELERLGAPARQGTTPAAWFSEPSVRAGLDALPLPSEEITFHMRPSRLGLHQRAGALFALALAVGCLVLGWIGFRSVYQGGGGVRQGIESVVNSLSGWPRQRDVPARSLPAPPPGTS